MLCGLEAFDAFFILPTELLGACGRLSSPPEDDAGIIQKAIAKRRYGATINERLASMVDLSRLYLKLILIF